MRFPRLVLGAALVVPLLVVAPPAFAEEASPPAAGIALAPLLSGLERHANAIEQMKKRASYTIRGKMEEVDGDGKASHTREMVTRVIASGSEVPEWQIVSYTDDGVDMTAEARRKADERKRAKKPAKGARRDFRLPFLGSEQPRYVFSVVERDAATPSRVRVAFAPKVAAEDAYKGNAWVDTTSGEVLTMGFSPSKNPWFVDHVDITVRFDNVTPLGRAPSNISFDGRGGFLFVKKHYRGSARLEDPQISK